MQMIDFVRTLVNRKAERQQQNASSWVELVTSLNSAKTRQDADRILAELDRHGKTIEELEAAADLLVKRRQWAKQLDEVAKAEGRYEKSLGKIRDEEAAFERLREEHEARMLTLIQERDLAVAAISLGGDAKRRLMETCSSAARQCATSEIDQRIAEAQRERNALRQRIKDRHLWLEKVEGYGKAAATDDVRMAAEKQAELREWRREESAFGARLEALQQELQTAAMEMLKPESI